MWLLKENIARPQHKQDVKVKLIWNKLITISLFKLAKIVNEDEQHWELILNLKSCFANTTTRKGLATSQSGKKSKFVLKLVTIQRVIIWKQHNQLHLQTTSWWREVTWEKSQDHNEWNFAKYYSSLSNLLFFLIYFLFFPHAYHSRLFPLSLFFSFFLLLTQLLFNSCCFKPWKNKRKKRKKIAYVIMRFVHFIFTLYYMVLHGV
jgi:hypothetical protein